VWRFLTDSSARGAPIHGSHDAGFVVVAAGIAILASFAALAVVDRMRATESRLSREAWLALGALAMGTGVWAMHFVGMLSWHVNVPVAFDATITLVSIIPAVIASGVALLILRAPTVRHARVVAGGGLMAAGIGTMHYAGMEALRMPAALFYRVDLFALSIVVAFLLSTAALYIRLVLQRHASPGPFKRWLGATVLGLAVTGMHYTAMQAARVHTLSVPSDVSNTIPEGMLGFLVTTAVIFLVGITVIGTRMDHRMGDLAVRLTSREARYRAVLHSMADGVLTFDATGTIESANPAAEAMFGVGPGELVGGAICGLMPELAAADLATGEHTPNDRDLFSVRDRRSITARRSTGVEFPVELRVSEIAVPRSGRDLFSAVVRDITEQVDAERRLLGHVRELEAARSALLEQASQLAVARDRAEQGARAKSEFLAAMSHELRTPMNGVLGMAQLLLHTPLSDEQATRVQMLRKSGESLLRIINDVLDFSKIEAGKLSIESHPFDLCAVLEEVRETLASAADVVGPTLAVEIDPLCPRHVMGDAGRIRQVLFNLVGNAIKFTDRGEVRVSASVSNEAGVTGVRLCVTDTGIGIAPETLQRLFAPFTQADATTTRKRGGTGLGLVISRKLCEMMGGTLSVTSAVGQGSTFWVTLPLAPAPDRGDGTTVRTTPSGANGAVPPADPHSTDPRGVRVLVAEDNMINQVVAVSLLAHLGCTVDVAADGREAVRRWSEGAYDLIFMDCQMPEMDGMEATRAIRASEREGSRIPIVALTANAMSDDREACLAAGMDDHISKPVSEEALLGALALARRD